MNVRIAIDAKIARATMSPTTRTAELSMQLLGSRGTYVSHRSGRG